MPLGRRHKRGQSRDEGERVQFNRRGSIGPRLLELQLHISVVENLQPVVGQRRAKDIFAQGHSALLVVCGDFGSSVKIEPVSLATQVAFGHGAVVRIQHDADGLVLLSPPRGRCAGSGRGQQLGQERIVLAHCLVGHDGDFTVARCRHEGDDPTALEKAENALTRALDDFLDLLLRGPWRGVEHLAPAIAIGRVDTIQERPDRETNNAFIYCLALAARKASISIVCVGTLSNRNQANSLLRP
jgi:hypothetical protein